MRIIGALLLLTVATTALAADKPVADWILPPGARSISVTLKRVKDVNPIPRPRPVIQTDRPAGTP